MKDTYIRIRLILFYGHRFLNTSSVLIQIQSFMQSNIYHSKIKFAVAYLLLNAIHTFIKTYIIKSTLPMNITTIYKNVNIKSIMIHYISVTLFMIAKAVGVIDSIAGYAMHSHFCIGIYYTKSNIINTGIGLAISILFIFVLYFFRNFQHIGLLCAIAMAIATSIFITELLIQQYPFPIVAIRYSHKTASLCTQAYPSKRM